jgi:hypothetical protein
MKVFKRDEHEYVYLQKFKSEFDPQIKQQNLVTYGKTNDIFNRFNKTEEKLMDEFIIKQFPETYIAFLEKRASNEYDKTEAQALMQSANDAK